MRDYLPYILVKLLSYILLILPKKARKLLLDTLATLTFRYSKKYRNIVIHNMKLVFRTLGDEEINQMAYESFKYLFYNFAHMSLSLIRPLKDIENNITIHNQEVVQNILDSGKKVVVFTAHISDWELMMFAFSKAFAKGVVIVRKPTNKYFLKQIINLRQKHKINVFFEGDNIKEVLKIANSSGAVGFAIDQYVGANRGDECEFFGHKIYAMNVAAKFAKTLNASLVPAFVKMVEFDKYEVYFGKEITIDGQSQADLVGLCMHKVEENIRQNPLEWLWVHRRFKGVE